MCVSNEQCHRQRKYFLTACRQGNIFPVYDFPLEEEGNGGLAGKEIFFLSMIGRMPDSQENL